MDTYRRGLKPLKVGAIEKRNRAIEKKLRNRANKSLLYHLIFLLCFIVFLFIITDFLVKHPLLIIILVVVFYLITSSFSSSINALQDEIRNKNRYAD